MGDKIGPMNALKWIARKGRQEAGGERGNESSIMAKVSRRA